MRARDRSATSLISFLLHSHVTLQVPSSRPLHRARFEAPPLSPARARPIKATEALFPTGGAPPPPPLVLEATHWQIDGFFRQFSYKCHQNRVAYVGD